MTDDQIFQKKQECAGYKSEMNIQLSWFSNFGGFFEVNEIFYSPVKKSCLYTVKVKYWESIWGDFIDNSLYGAIVDYLNNTIIQSTFSELNNTTSPKSSCYTKYMTGDMEKITDENQAKSIMQNYFSCMKTDLDKNVKELKGE